MTQNFNDALRKQLRLIDDYARFYAEHHMRKDITLGHHQLFPVFDMACNGTKRILLDYTTSAGKTTIGFEAIRQLKRTRKQLKTLLVAPFQSIADAWEETEFKKSGVPFSRYHVLSGLSATAIPPETDVLLVNYEKLHNHGNYIRPLQEYARHADLVIIDECHNLKNIHTHSTKGLVSLIEANKDAHLLALSATAVPNKIKDAGIILYLLNPEMYAHYKDRVFDSRTDWEAVSEVIKSGQWKYFPREHMQSFFSLPKLDLERLSKPVRVAMMPDDEKAYFAAYTSFYDLVLRKSVLSSRKMANVMVALERCSLRALYRSSEFRRHIQDYLNQGYMLSFYSRLKTGFFERHKAGLSGELVDFLRSFEEVHQVEMISGRAETPYALRKRIQERVAGGEIDALLNQWSTTAEGFGMPAGSRPVVTIPLLCPFDWGTLDQIIGRHYRAETKSQCDVAIFLPDSQSLKEQIDSFVRHEARKRDIRIKASWAATLFAEDAYEINRSKREHWKLLTERVKPNYDDERIEVGLGDYGRFTQGRVVASSSHIARFGKGPKDALRHVGSSYGEGLQRDIEAMADDYDRPDILLEIPGRLNLFLAEKVEELKQQRHQQRVSWNVADWGCCSSAPFAQARIFVQAREQTSGARVGIDTITNVDGHEGILHHSREYLTRGEWISTLSQLNGRHETENARAASKLLRSKLYWDKVCSRLRFHHANFARDAMPKKAYHAIVTSQVFQYNNQDDRRDIEDILLRINQSLRPSGYHLAVLTNNSKVNGFTSREDFRNFIRLEEAYQFDVLYADFIQGYDSISPFYFLLAKKQGDQSGYAPVQMTMYPRTIMVLTGGKKLERLFDHGNDDSSLLFPFQDIAKES